MTGRQTHEDEGVIVYGLALETLSTQAVRGTQTWGLEQGQQYPQMAVQGLMHSGQPRAPLARGEKETS